MDVNDAFQRAIKKLVNEYVAFTNFKNDLNEVKAFLSHGSDSKKMLDMLEKMNFDFLLESSNISRMLFEELHDKSISPRGIRIIGKTDILEKYLDSLVLHFGTLDKILSLGKEELSSIFGNEDLAHHFIEKIDMLKEKIMLGKKI